MTTIDTLLDELAQFLSRGALQVRYEPTEMRGQAGGTYVAYLPLRAILPVELDGLAARHIGDVEAFVDELVNVRVKPFGNRLERAAGAAINAWQAVIEEPENLRG